MRKMPTFASTEITEKIKYCFMKKKTTFVLTAFATLLTLCGCSGNGRDNTPVRSVMLVQPLRPDAETTHCFPGIVKEARQIELGFKTPGQIKQILVDEGDYVQAGQLLATLDDVDYQLGVDALQIQYDQLSDELERMKQLHASKSLSDNDYEKALAGLRQLQVQLQSNRNKLEYTRLQAPVSGYVQHVNFEPAEMVDAGTAVFTLIDVHRLEVEADIPVGLYTQRKDISAITCEGLPMHLCAITPKADGTQLYRIRLTFEKESAPLLTAGANTEVHISLSQPSDTTSTCLLPPHALFQHEGQTCVWVLQPDSTVLRVPVTSNGLDNTGNAIISSGLKGNEQVIRAGVHQLQEHEKVSPIAPSTPTNVGGLL